MRLNGKSRSKAVQKPISIKNVAGAVLVLLAAAAIGVAIREFRLRSWEKQLAQAPKAAQPADLPKTGQPPKEPETQNIQEQLPIEEVPVEPEPPAPQPAGPTSPEADGQSNTAAQAPLDQDPRLEDPAIKERRGREALALIGHNPEADAVWIQMINDPSLSASARSNLIEDLNEDGLSYRNLTLDDLPVIQYRIELVEDLQPYALDKVNSDAFAEAHKDLVNMADRLTRR